MSDFRIDVRVRNHLLLSAIEGSMCKTIAGVAENGGPSIAVTYAFVNIKRTPQDKFGNWDNYALRICDTIGVLPDEVFTEAHYEILKTNRAQFVSNMQDISRLIESKDPCELLENKQKDALMWSALDGLNPREKQVLQFRNIDDLTLDEVAERLDLSKERVRQIEAKAIRKLRHPSKRKFFPVIEA
tara:strand:+ start:573 stop:1130 length:558 start_codon:yes stop_codon:yes gene_type:complete